MTSASKMARILIVDDNSENRDMLERRLAKKGFICKAVSDGEAALRALQWENYQLILLDDMMPGMSGIEVLQAVRTTRTATELPIIMATAKICYIIIVFFLLTFSLDQILLRLIAISKIFL